MPKQTCCCGQYFGRVGHTKDISTNPRVVETSDSWMDPTLPTLPFALNIYDIFWFQELNTAHILAPHILNHVFHVNTFVDLYIIFFL